MRFTMRCVLVLLVAAAVGPRGARAKQPDTGSLVLVAGSAEWCGPCRRFAKDREEDARLRAELQRWSFVEIADATPEGERELRRLAIRAFPTFILRKPSGEEVARWAGYADAKTLLRRVRSEAADPRPVTEKIAGFDTAPSAGLAASIASTLAASSQGAEAARWFARAVELDPSLGRELLGDAFYATSAALAEGDASYDDLVVAGERWISAARGQREVVRSVASLLAGSVPDGFDRERLRPVMTRALSTLPARPDPDDAAKRDAFEAALRPPMPLDARLAALDENPTRDGTLALLSDLQAAARHADASRIARRMPQLDPEHAAQLSLIALSVTAEALPSGQVTADDLQAAGDAALKANAADPHVLLQVHDELSRSFAAARASQLAAAHLEAGLALATGDDDASVALGLRALRAAVVDHDAATARALYGQALGDGWEADPLRALDMAEFLLDIGGDREETERLIRSLHPEDDETRGEAERLLARIAATPGS